MPYLVMVHATFDTLTDAQSAYDSIRLLADKSKREWIGTAGERTSWSGVYDEQPDGTLTEIASWHLDDIETVKEGKPLKGGTKLTLDNTPTWVSTATYPKGYDVAHINKFWRSQIDGNVSEPGKGNSQWLEVTTV